MGRTGMRCRLGYIVLLAFAGSSANGASAQTSAAANPVMTASANGIRDAAHERRLALRRLDVAVEQRGGVTETTVEASFANASGEPLEGDFRMTLPDGAVVTGYALDVGGAMVDGVLVDRPRARAVYEARVRRRVDPGLAEVSVDNVFSTRVFPILPGRGRTVRVRFVAPLGRDGWRMPLGFEAPVEGWSVSVHATGVTAAPGVTLAGKPLAVETVSDGFAARLARKAMPLAGELTIAAAPVPDSVASSHRNGERDLQLSGDLPGGAETQAPPARLRIYWDRSRSRLGGRIDAEIALVERAIAAWHPSTIELVAFNSTGAQRHVVKDAAEAVAVLRSVQYRGATSFAPIATDGPADLCLMFSDGRPAVDRAVDVAPRCPLDAISSAAGDDRAWLRHLATTHGGRLVALDKDAGAAFAELNARSTGVVAVLDRDGRALPFVPIAAAAGRWSVIVRAPSFGPVTVRVAGAGNSRDVVARTYGDAAPFDGDGALIAQDALATLAGTDQREAFVALSRRYGIASPTLSFLVLETAADYLAAKVEPPATVSADVRDDYRRQLKAGQADDARQARERFDRLVTDWRAQVAWWKTRFDPAARPRKVAISQAFDRSEAGEALQSPPPPPPPPAPPPPVMASPAVAAPPVMSAPAPAMADRAAQDVIVTASRAASPPGRTSATDAENQGDPRSQPTVQIDAWQPDRPYLELYDGKPSEFESRFLEAEARHGALPIFYLDTAEWLRRHDRVAEATEMVLSAIELPTADEVTLGIVADRLERYGAYDRAIELRERQAALDPDRPQPRRLLALALARRAAAMPATARGDLTRAIAILYAVATGTHAPEWDGIELIALDEANALLPRLRRLGGTADMDSRLVALLDVDVRVVIDWTTDASDMDLWVDQPDRERAIYNNQRTAIGGLLSHDMTRGYGPEEYLLHIAPAGTYTVQANVFAPDRIDPNGATILTAHLFRDFGRPTQREESVDVELKRDEKGAKMLGRIVVPARGR